MEENPMLARTRKAFTLLELIVVIVILGILAALAIPTFAAVIARSKVKTDEAAALSLGRDAIALAAFDSAKATDDADGTGTGTDTYLNLVDSESAATVTSVTAGKATITGPKGTAVKVVFTDNTVDLEK
jgi:prepilin-type N-terminal cleavage/methylation domain-containing protein